MAWLKIMPFDVIKSKIQADRNNKVELINLIKAIYKQSGLLGFYQGLAPTVVRGFIVNAVILCVYSRTLNFLNNKKNKI